MKFNYKRLIVSLALPQLAGAIGSVFTASEISGWYAALAKPALNPPGWVFGPAWAALYFLMGLSFFLIWKSGPSRAPRERRRGVFLFFTQLFLNAVWSIIFFGLHSPFWALADIVLLWLAIAWTIVVFYGISRPAAYLLIPYILWVSFAGYLNYAIWALN